MITNKSKIKLKDFPLFTCVMYTVTNTLTKQKIHNNEACVSLYRDYEWCCAFDCRLIPYNSAGIGNIWRGRCRGHLEEGDRLAFHPKCDIPISQISRYKTVSSRSPELPTKLVVPMRGGDRYHAKSSYNVLADRCVLFISYVHKIVIVLSLGYPTDTFTENDFKELFHNTLSHEYPEDYFSLLDDGQVFSILYSISTLDYAILTGMIPQNKIICEKYVPVNSEPLTFDIIKSTYSLLCSPDAQVRETALINLGQHNTAGYQFLVWWLLNTFWNYASAYKQKNSGFRWLCILLDPDGPMQKPYMQTEIKMARELVKEYTDGGVYWDEQDQCVLLDKSSLRKRPGVYQLFNCLT